MGFRSLWYEVWTPIAKPKVKKTIEYAKCFLWFKHKVRWYKKYNGYFCKYCGKTAKECR